MAIGIGAQVPRNGMASFKNAQCDITVKNRLHKIITKSFISCARPAPKAHHNSHSVALSSSKA
jgi:hypothetical protein